MSLHLNFEPHSWYRGHAIQHTTKYERHDPTGYDWHAYTDSGMTGYLVEHEADTLADLKQQISEYEQREADRIARLYAQHQ